MDWSDEEAVGGGGREVGCGAGAAAGERVLGVAEGVAAALDPDGSVVQVPIAEVESAGDAN